MNKEELYNYANNKLNEYLLDNINNNNEFGIDNAKYLINHIDDVVYIIAIKKLRLKYKNEDINHIYSSNDIDNFIERDLKEMGFNSSFPKYDELLEFRSRVILLKTFWSSNLSYYRSKYMDMLIDSGRANDMMDDFIPLQVTGNYTRKRN